MNQTTQIESKYGILLTLQVLLKNNLINRETYDKIIRAEFSNYPIK